jgi:hypothetical protein
MTLHSFRSVKSRAKVKQIDPLAHVIAQMQGLIDSSEGATDLTEQETAFRGLVCQWHAMLQSCLVDAAKRTH